MSIIAQILFSFSMAFVATEVLHVKEWHILLNRKPFKCCVCMSGWFALLLHGFDLMSIPVMCAAMVTTIFLKAILFRL